MEEKTNQPLVSIIVITFNSSKFVLETLESAKAQTYLNIELIITDDGSIDDTSDICKKWIDENEVRFVSATLLVSQTNAGIPANINRGVDLAKGIWIKCIAGDDRLSEECITELIYFITTQQEDIRVLFSDVVRFYGNSIKNVEINKYDNSRFCSRESSADDQYQILLRSNSVYAAAAIIRRDLLLSVNGFDERFKLMEDWPLWVKITEAGHKIYYLDKPLVYYRLHENNLSMTTDQNYLYHPVSKINISFKEKELIPRLPFIERWGLKHDILGIKVCFLLGNNKKNPFTRFVHLVFHISNPFYNYLRIKNILGIT
jgi:glycosyltransferase involved in cell wall biosynthesis